MMRPRDVRTVVYLCVEPVDFRKQINGLALLVTESLSLDPFSTELYVFTNRRKTQIKILTWEDSGFTLWLKRLERERFAWPKAPDSVVRMSTEQLNLLLEGYDIWRMRPHAKLSYRALS